MKIFGPGAYTVANKGDAALVHAYLDWLRLTLGADHIELTSFTPGLDEQYYGVPVMHMPMRPNAWRHQFAGRVASRLAITRWLLRKWRLFFFSLAIPAIFMWARAYRLAPNLVGRISPRSWRDVADAVGRADISVAVPGGYLNAPTPDSDWWLFHVPALALSRAFDKFLVLSPCSIGPFADDHRPIASKVLGWADLILLREDVSYSICRDLGIADERLLRTPDLAFKFATSSDERERVWASEVLPNDRSEYIGVSVRYHSFPGAEDPARSRGEYLDAVAESIARVVHASGAQPVIVPQVLEDHPVGEALAERLAKRGVSDVLNLNTDFTPSQLCALYERLRLLVGTRMHANIFAMSVGTPVVAIGYEPKTRGILSDMGLLAWYLEIEETSGGLPDLVSRQWGIADQLRDEAAAAARAQAEAFGGVDEVLRRAVFEAKSGSL